MSVLFHGNSITYLFYRGLKISHSCFNRNRGATLKWLSRQVKDPYVVKRLEHNYRARSAFKLLEIDDKFRLLKYGQRVIDLGAAPGSWSQVLVERTNSDGHVQKKPIGSVIACDLSLMSPLPGVTIVEQSDFMLEPTRVKLTQLIAGKQVNGVVSDMAPNSSGHKSLDHFRIYELVNTAFEFSCDYLTPGGFFVCKMLDGSMTSSFIERLKERFNNVKRVKPDASRDESAELFIVATSFDK